MWMPEGVIHITNVPTDTNVPYVLVMKEKRVIIELKGSYHGLRRPYCKSLGKISR